MATTKIKKEVEQILKSNKVFSKLINTPSSSNSNSNQATPTNNELTSITSKPQKGSITSEIKQTTVASKKPKVALVNINPSISTSISVSKQQNTIKSSTSSNSSNVPNFKKSIVQHVLSNTNIGNNTSNQTKKISIKLFTEKQFGIGSNSTPAIGKKNPLFEKEFGSTTVHERDYSSNIIEKPALSIKAAIHNLVTKEKIESSIAKTMSLNCDIKKQVATSVVSPFPIGSTVKSLVAVKDKKANKIGSSNNLGLSSMLKTSNIPNSSVTGNKRASNTFKQSEIVGNQLFNTAKCEIMIKPASIEKSTKNNFYSKQDQMQTNSDPKDALAMNPQSAKQTVSANSEEDVLLKSIKNLGMIVNSHLSLDKNSKMHGDNMKILNEVLRKANYDNYGLDRKDQANEDLSLTNFKNSDFKGEDDKSINFDLNAYEAAKYEAIDYSNSNVNLKKQTFIGSCDVKLKSNKFDNNDLFKIEEESLFAKTIKQEDKSKSLVSTNQIAAYESPFILRQQNAAIKKESRIEEILKDSEDRIKKYGILFQFINDNIKEISNLVLDNEGVVAANSNKELNKEQAACTQPQAKGKTLKKSSKPKKKKESLVIVTEFEKKNEGSNQSNDKEFNYEEAYSTNINMINFIPIINDISKSFIVSSINNDDFYKNLLEDNLNFRNSVSSFKTIDFCKNQEDQPTNINNNQYGLPNKKSHPKRSRQSNSKHKLNPSESKRDTNKFNTDNLSEDKTFCLYENENEEDKKNNDSDSTVDLRESSKRKKTSKNYTIKKADSKKLQTKPTNEHVLSNFKEAFALTRHKNKDDEEDTIPNQNDIDEYCKGIFNGISNSKVSL